MPNKWLVSSFCIVEFEPKHHILLIGDDMRMNGLDAPARIRNKRELTLLTDKLNELGSLLPEDENKN